MLIGKKNQQNFHCQSVLVSSTSIYPHNLWQLCGCCPSSIWLYPWSFPPFNSASSFQQCLVFCPVGHIDFGDWQWESAGVVWHVDSYSLTPALFEERGCWAQGSSSHLFWFKQKAPQWLFSETQTEMKWQAIWGWTCQVSFIWKICGVDFWQPHSGFSPRASLHKPLNLQNAYFWIATGVFHGQFLCSV